MKSRFAPGPLLLGSVLVIASWRAEAQTFTTLYTFTATPPYPLPSTNSDGVGPYGGLVLSGNTLYGNARSGGSAGTGTIFKMNTDGSDFTNLYSFTAVDPNSSSNSDGAYPYGGLILSDNMLYGTTEYGGSSGHGTVFKINTDGSGFTRLRSFTGFSGYNSSSIGTNGDGAYLNGSVVLSGNTLYGTAAWGGSEGYGTVFAINTDGTGFRTLHHFTQVSIESSNHNANSDGAGPKCELILSGNTLYGTTTVGGSSGNGTVFKLNTNGTGFTTLYSFTRSDPTYYTNSDGRNPQNSLLLSGNTLFGLAIGGGSSGHGTVFAINTDGTGFTNLYNFTATEPLDLGTNNDGAAPLRLILSGNVLYGTAQGGGAWGMGTLYKLNTNGTGFTTLHSFSQAYPTYGTNSDGYFPQGLILSGNTLYGEAAGGGSSNSGTIFSQSVEAINPPQLTISHSAANVILSWPTNATSFVLQSATTLANGGDWQDFNLTPTEINGQNVIAIGTTNTVGFFRLRQP